jgi:hypothetical protein
MLTNLAVPKKACLIAGSAVLLLVLRLAAQEVSSLVINGHSGSAKVVQVQGRNYVDVDGLARITNGTISFKDNSVVLSLPTAPSAPPTEEEKGLSRSFLLAGIEVGARIREWHAALRTAIERGVPLTTGWLNNYQTQAEQSLRVAQVAMQSDADRAAYPLLEAEFNNMKSLQDKYVSMATNLQYIDPNSLASDPLNQKVVACGHALTSMASTRTFTGEGACQ